MASPVFDVALFELVEWVPESSQVIEPHLASLLALLPSLGVLGPRARGVLDRDNMTESSCYRTVSKRRSRGPALRLTTNRAKQEALVLPRFCARLCIAQEFDA
jgi:hypothetical protein